ncbi:MAG: DUF3105 domain-containing protein [Dehalococcoidia bacterium]|nr:MAG: DUF3105 domain-containing protein [Dehalococcoidia bacterium]
MGKNRRQERLQQRRAQAATPAAPAAARPAAKPVAQWRHTLDQWGGPWVLIVGVVIIAFIGWLAWNNRPVGVSTGALKGDAVTLGPATHVDTADKLQIPEGFPPAGGPHLVNPLPAGNYNDPVEDGRAIHSLEHGIIWITYKPDQVSEAQLKALKKVQDDYPRDVILSPRPLNKDAVVLTSWGRRQVIDPGDTKVIKEFITANLNRSPEPAVR